MPTKIIVARDKSDLVGVTELLREYLIWDIGKLREVSGVELDAETYVENTLAEISLYFPPRGRLILARAADRLVGIGF
jgi:hypothetical protein